MRRNSHLALPWVPPPHLLNIAPHPWTVVAATNTVSASTARCLISPQSCSRYWGLGSMRRRPMASHGWWGRGRVGASEAALPPLLARPSQSNPLHGLGIWGFSGILGDSWGLSRSLKSSNATLTNVFKSLKPKGQPTNLNQPANPTDLVKSKQHHWF